MTLAHSRDVSALPVASTRLVRSTGTRPADLLEAELAAATPLAPVVGWQHPVRLDRDYYVRVLGNDYCVDPAVIGRLVDNDACLHEVVGTCEAPGGGRR